MSDRITFRYGNTLWVLVVSSLIFGCFITYVFLKAAMTMRQGEWIYLAVASPAAIFFMCVGPLAFRDIYISSYGIGRSVLGISCRFVKWDEIVSVRCGVIAPDGTTTTYNLQTSEGNLLTGLRVMAMVDDVEKLHALVSAELAKRSVPITGWDVNKRISVSQLPPPAKGMAAWQ